LEEIKMRARVLESLPKKFSSELYDRLILVEGLHLATKSMAINKSLSTYGVVVEFYLFFWEVIKEELSQMIKVAMQLR
jgi:hypothetical protein